MQVSLTVRHGDLKPGIREYIEGKAEKLVHYFERVTQIEVTVDLSADHQTKVEIQVDAEHKHDFVASETDPEVRPAFDKCMSKMEKQIRRYKDRVQDHRGDPSTHEVAGSPFDDESDD